MSAFFVNRFGEKGHMEATGDARRSKLKSGPHGSCEGPFWRLQREIESRKGTATMGDAAR